MIAEDRPPARIAPPSPADLDRRIGRVVTRARLSALWEEIWRRLMPILWVGGLHVALSWLGVYAALPTAARLGLFGLVTALLLIAVVAALRNRGAIAAALDRRGAIGRVEAASGLTGHELSGLSDRLAVAVDPATERLWAAHRRRLAARIGPLAAGWPHPDLGRRDRFALRPLLAMALFVGWFAAGGDHLARLAAPFASEPVPSPDDRVDVWIDPPAYTGRPPVVLIAEGRATTVGSESGDPAPVPQGSRLVVRVASGEAGRAPQPLTVTVASASGNAVSVAPEPAEGRRPATAPVEYVAKLDADGEVRLQRANATIARWTIAVLPDRPPSIRLVDKPEPQRSGTLKIGHETADDWGIAAAEGRIALLEGAKGRPLYEAPRFPLALPIGRGRNGAATTLRDLTNHPFAGATVRLTLSAQDEAGQEGTSETIELRLPERPFRKPLARALVELRRRLALDAGEASVVSTALDALTLAPERFEEKPGVHLGLVFLARRAAAARTDDGLRELVDLLWAAATTIEDGDVADHEKALRQAQEALRKAIEEGASEEEIARLTRELRQAMEKYLAARAEQARRNPQSRAERGGAQKTITDRDLQRMLDRIEQLARTGSREAAEKLLEELREMMENLQVGAGSGEGEGNSASETLEKLGEMIRRQQELMEETHRAERGEAGEDDGRGAMGRLGEGQGELRETLRRFAEENRGRGRSDRPTTGQGERGSGPGGSEDGSEDFDSADREMGEAGEALRSGEGEAALEAQTRALEALRRGARKLADQMAGENGRGGRDGEAGDDGEDPLGRPRKRGSMASGKVKVPDEIDVERARRILDDIRNRLGEPARPKFERDYLDRLLRIDR